MLAWYLLVPRVALDFCDTLVWSEKQAVGDDVLHVYGNLHFFAGD